VPPGCDLMLIARAAAQHLPIPELARKFSDACAQIPPPRQPAPPAA
jgi:RNase P protein component